MSIMRYFVIIFLTVFIASPAFANFEFNSRCKLAYEKMMVFDFGSAERILMAEKVMNPNNKVPIYIETYIAFFKAAITEVDEDVTDFESKYSIAIDAIDNDKQDSPFKKYFLSDIYIQGAYLKAISRSYMSGAYRFNKAYDKALDNQKEFPDFMPNNKLLSLMNIGIGSVPENYDWLLRMFNFEGDVNKGISQAKKLLKSAANEDEYHYLLSESLFLYSFTIVNFDLDTKSEKELNQIYSWPKIESEIKLNQFMTFSKASFLTHIKSNDEAIKCLANCQPPKSYQRFHYLDYMFGECLLYKPDSNALTYFKKYVSEFNGNSYVRSSYQKRAWMYLLFGDTEKYHSEMAACLKYGNDLRDADQRATQAAEDKELPNKYLLKARLLFDGGYYSHASDVLSRVGENSFTKTRDRAEFVYRYGRIYDEWGNRLKAIAYYNKCINE